MRRMACPEDPFLVTLVLDERSQREFDDLRRRHFPPERLLVGAHLTLFHKLPPEHGAALVADCADVATRPPFAVRSVGVRFLGRGVAVDVEAPELADLRAELATRWQPWLSAQDRQPFRGHVTVQNKVEPAVARTLHEALGAAFVPGEHGATGLDVWRYRGGPWEHVRRLPFAR
ncbi:MAG: 2'-5' RNA ligase family protein [Sporichthyaceae bacterium]